MTLPLMPSIIFPGFRLRKSMTLASASSQSVNRTLGTPTLSSKWTWAAWIKQNTASANVVLLYASSGTNMWVAFGGATYGGASNTFVIASSAFNTLTVSTATFTTTGAWNHFQAAADTGAGAGLKYRLYTDGTEVSYTSHTEGTNSVNTAVAHTMGKDGGSSSAFFDGKMADVYFIDGQQLTPSSFISGTGAGTCHPIKYAGTYGNNGFHLDFANADTADSSGNGNTWTQVNTPTFTTDVPT